MSSCPDRRRSRALFTLTLACFAAVTIGAQTPEELARLDAAFPPGAAAGDRYTPEIARWAGR